MEETEKSTAPIDLAFLMSDLQRVLKRYWALGILMVALFAAAVAFFEYRSYRPIYEASATFAVKVINPLYSSANGYNAQTAGQMEKTFPYILSSNALREKVQKSLGISSMPSITAETTPGTNIFTLRVRDSDAGRANEVLQAMVIGYPEVAEFVIGPTRMTLLDETGVPSRPMNPYSVKSAAVKGGVLGLLAWLVLSVVLAFTRSTVHNEEELGRLLNVPCLGTLPVTKVVGKNASCPLAHHDHGKRGFRESTQLLGVRLEKALQGKQIMLVSSAEPGEGKTTVSANMGAALAKNGKKVLLVDCDLRNPSVAKAYGLSEGEGLSDFLEGRAGGSQTVKKTDVTGLYVITGGKAGRKDPARLLSGERMKALMAWGRKNFDVIILDTSPCAVLADASELAELADCALLVIRQDYAPRDRILDGVRYLTDSKLPIIGAVLNGTPGHNRYGYGSYYGYGYGYGK